MDRIVENAVKSGDSVLETGFLYDFEIQWAKDAGTVWYRSKNKKGGDNPFASFMLNKKWSLEEEFTNHIMRFQQVTFMTNSTYFSKINWKF